MKKLQIFVICLLFCCWATIASAVKEQRRPSTPDLLGDDIDFDDPLDDFDDGFGGDFGGAGIHDPLEPLNRIFFSFNDRIYFWVLKPVKVGYSYAIPKEIRGSFGSFFDNVAAPVRLVNTLLQGRFRDSGAVASRFLINSTVGVLGLADVAQQEFGINARSADFGQTLGLYGVGEGIYVCWPILGPSNLRDTFGLAGDTFLNPTSYYIDMTLLEQSGYYVFEKINAFSLMPDLYEDLKKYSLDPYSATRQAMYDFRRNKIKQAKAHSALAPHMP